MKPILEDLSEECPEVAFYKVNVDEQQALAVQFGISSIPTFCFFDGGALVQTVIGAQPKAQLVRVMEGCWGN